MIRFPRDMDGGLVELRDGKHVSSEEESQLFSGFLSNVSKTKGITPEKGFSRCYAKA